MSILSMYNACVPVLDRHLSNLEYVLKKGEANALERSIDPEVFLNARLAPDMLGLIGQVSIAAAISKACPYRLVGDTPPAYDDDMKTFADLYARIARARADMAKVDKARIDGTEERAFSVKMGPSDRDFTGITYLSGFALPNVLFHCTTAYNILRHNGVPLGKRDFFGGL